MADHEEKGQEDLEKSSPDDPPGDPADTGTVEDQEGPIRPLEDLECLTQSVENLEYPTQSLECLTQSVEDQVDQTQSLEDLECPGCQTLGVLTLFCGHQLCPSCLALSREELGQSGCTVCYGSQLMDSVLQTLLDALFQGQPRRRGAGSRSEDEEEEDEDPGRDRDGYEDVETEDVCLHHGEELSGFCLEEEQLICSRCRTEEHERHQCCSVQEAVLDCKRELRCSIRNLQEQLESLTSIRQTWEETAAHITTQSVTVAQVLREEFEKMHQYLHDEEAAMMSQLKQEDEEKSQRMKRKIDRISDDIRVLSDSIRETEEAIGLEGFLFLKNYRKASDRAQTTVEEPEEESGSLLDVAKHQACVQHQVWDKMMRIIQYFPVTLDPNTGSACLGVSQDLSSVFVCDRQPLPDNPERFSGLLGVLGSEGFSSGRHSWEVEVGDNSHWSLGVASETVNRKDRSASDLDPSGGLWTVSLSSGDYRASPGPGSSLRLRRRPRKVLIQLDWERGCLTFSDANDNSLIHRFKKQWSGSLRPYFSTTCSKHPLEIAAGRVTVTVE